MYVSIDLSANLRLDTVVLWYITSIFLVKLNLFLSSYKNSFIFMTIFRRKQTTPASDSDWEALPAHSHAQTGPSWEVKPQWELQLAVEPQTGHQAHSQLCGTLGWGPWRGSSAGRSPTAAGCPPQAQPLLAAPRQLLLGRQPKPKTAPRSFNNSCYVSESGLFLTRSGICVI